MWIPVFCVPSFLQGLVRQQRKKLEFSDYQGNKVFVWGLNDCHQLGTNISESKVRKEGGKEGRVHVTVFVYLLSLHLLLNSVPHSPFSFSSLLQVKTPTESRALAKLHPVQFVGGSKSLFIVSHDGKVDFHVSVYVLFSLSVTLPTMCLVLFASVA